MPLPLLIPAAIAGAKTLYTAFNKPKLQEPKYLLEGLDKQIAENGADIVNKTLMSNLTSSAKSMGAKMYQQQQRGINAMTERGELSEGQKARALLDAGTQTQTEVGNQTQGAILSQADANQRNKALMDEARLNIARIKDEARQRLNAENQQWRNELAGGVLDTVTAGFNGIMQGIQDKKVQDSLTKFMTSTGKTNLTELDDNQLNGLLTQLMMAKMGLQMPESGTDMLGNAPLNIPVSSPVSQGTDLLHPLRQPLGTNQKVFMEQSPIEQVDAAVGGKPVINNALIAPTNTVQPVQPVTTSAPISGTEYTIQKDGDFSIGTNGEVVMKKNGVWVKARDAQGNKIKAKLGQKIIVMPDGSIVIGGA